MKRPGTLFVLTWVALGFAGSAAARAPLGTEIASQGHLAHPSPREPASFGGEELCNGLDDDGDGEIDEGFTVTQYDPFTEQFVEVGPLGFCVLGVGACETRGILLCSADGLSLECFQEEPPIEPGEEGPYLDPSCTNLIDDDCDGRVDCDDPDCEGPEVCDGCDNDLNGQVDELWPTLGQSCTVGQGPCARTGVVICKSDGSRVICSAQPMPAGVEGPPGYFNCSDGFDNDCDTLIDLDDPDCQMAEICDGADNDGDTQIDEDFPLLGQTCVVGVGACERTGVYICSADATGVICSVTPGPQSPEGPGCDCGDGIDNDCDGVMDLNDPDCGGHILRVQAALPLVCSGPNGDCRSWHTVQWQTLNGGPNLTETAELLILNDSGAITDSITVAQGDAVRFLSRTGSVAVSTSRDLSIDLNYYGSTFLPCMLGPGVPVPTECEIVDTDCDHDVDLEDATWVEQNFGRQFTIRDVSAPNIMLRVLANNGVGQATAYASPIPQIKMWSPDDTVISLSEGDRLRVDVALPEIDLATFELRLDGVDVFAALGLNPASDFPGGPYGGPIALPNGCVATICEMIVDGANLETNAANSLSMFVENMCCGGHRFHASGDRRVGSYPDPTPPECYEDDFTESEASHGFEIEITTPTDGFISPGPLTAVFLRICHGVALPSPPVPWVHGLVKVNGASYALSHAPSITFGDGVFTADEYVYLFGEDQVAQTDLFQDVVLGNHVPGTLDPGGNVIIAEVADAELNTAHDRVRMALGPVSPGGGRTSRAIVLHGFSVTATEPALDTIVTEVLKRVAALVVEELENALKALRGSKMTLSFAVCDPEVSLLVNDPVPVSFNMDLSAFTYDVTPTTDQVDVAVTSGQASLAGSVKGVCEIEGMFGECMIRVVVKVGLQVNVAQAEVTATVTENDLLAGNDITPELIIENGDVSISVQDVGSAMECWAGELLDIFSFGALDDAITAFVRAYLEAYLDDLDVTEYLGLIPVPLIPLDVLDFEPVNLGALKVNLNFDMTEVEITPNGMAVGFETVFVPTEIDPEVQTFPGVPQDIASLPLPPLLTARSLTALISDDAVNQLLHALTRNGIFKTEFEDVRQLQDLLPADCATLPASLQGQCAAIQGTPCQSLADPDALLVCLATQAMLAELNLSATTPILLHGRVDVPPKFLIWEPPVPSIPAYLRLSQAFVGIVADRDGDGVFSGNYNSLPSCFSGNPATSTECAIWGSCHNVNFQVALSLSFPSAGVLRLNLDVVDVDLSMATGCSGGTVTPGGLGAFETIFEGLVFDLIRDYVDDNFPPLDLDGLDFGGIITLENLSTIVHGNEFDPHFMDTCGITADPAPNP